MKTHIIYSDEFSSHDNSNHPENAKRLLTIMTELKNSSVFDNIDIIKPNLLSEELLFNVHSKNMIENVKYASIMQNSWLDPDTYVCKNDYNVARLAAGGLVDLTNKVINNINDNGFALIRPPGHHATQNRSMGFCLFNNIAIAASFALKKLNRILIFDLDVHHGNGTQDIFYKSKKIMYQSFHLSPHYPGSGETNEIGKDDGIGYNVNTPLSYGNGDLAVNQLLDEVFLPIANQFKPELILVSCGYDSHHADILGGLNLTADCFGEIISKFQKIQNKIVCTLEGGYNLDWIGKCCISQISQLLYNQIKIKDDIQEKKNIDDLLKKINNEMNVYWKL